MLRLLCLMRMMVYIDGKLVLSVVKLVKMAVGTWRWRGMMVMGMNVVVVRILGVGG